MPTGVWHRGWFLVDQETMAEGYLRISFIAIMYVGSGRSCFSFQKMFTIHPLGRARSDLQSCGVDRPLGFKVLL